MLPGEAERTVGGHRRRELQRSVERASGSVTRLTSPSSYPRSALIGSPVSASSLAMFRGSMCGSRSRPPPAATSERLTSGTPSLAPCAATIRSQASAISRPPATAKPSIAAISGLSEDALDDTGEAAARDPRHLSAGEGLQIHAGAEIAAGARDNCHRQLGVGVELVERCRDSPAPPRALTALR